MKLKQDIIMRSVSDILYISRYGIILLLSYPSRMIHKQVDWLFSWLPWTEEKNKERDSAAAFVSDAIDSYAAELIILFAEGSYLLSIINIACIFMGKSIPGWGWLIAGIFPIYLSIRFFTEEKIRIKESEIRSFIKTHHHGSATVIIITLLFVLCSLFAFVLSFHLSSIYGNS